MDGLLLHAGTESERVEAFIRSRIMESILREQELLRDQRGHERIADMQFTVPTQELS